MKRCISILLTSAMILSLMGCAKETEETKKKKKKKTTTTEVTETEAPDTSETDDTSETEDSSETEDTSETEAPTETEESSSETEDSSATSSSGNTVDPSSVKLTHDLELLTLIEDSESHAYAEASDPDTPVFMISSYCNSFEIANPGYAELKKEIGQQFESNIRDTKEAYNTLLDSFSDNKANAAPDDYFAKDQSISTTTEIMRSDSKVFSYERSVYTWLAKEGYSFTSTCYNYDPNTGDLIELKDIITDKAAFADAVMAYCPKDDPQIQEEVDTIKAMADTIRNGSFEVEFLIYQNSILLKKTGGEEGYEQTYNCAVSVMELGNCVDLSYFTSTPRDYALMSDYSNGFTWDFDGDGKLDRLEFEGTGWGSTLKATYNGTTTELGNLESDLDGYDSVVSIYMISIDDNYFVYLSCSTEDPTLHTLVLRLNNGKLEKTGTFSQFSDYPYNPNNLGVDIRGDLLGTGIFEKECYLSSDNGLPLEYTSFYEKEGIGATKRKMTLGLFDEDGNPTGKSITIPANTCVKLIGIDLEKELAYFVTLNKDESKNQEFQMVIRKDPDFEYFDVTFDGESSYELFYGCPYYD